MGQPSPSATSTRMCQPAAPGGRFGPIGAPGLSVCCVDRTRGTPAGKFVVSRGLPHSAASAQLPSDRVHRDAVAPLHAATSVARRAGSGSPTRGSDPSGAGYSGSSPTTFLPRADQAAQNRPRAPSTGHVPGSIRMVPFGPPVPPVRAARHVSRATVTPTVGPVRLFEA